MSSACISAADDNLTSEGDTDSSTQGVSDDSQVDDEGSTGDEEIDLDVTYDDESGEASDDSNANVVSVDLSKHATGIPIVMLFVCLLLPILRRK